MNVIFDFDGTIVGPESLPLLASVVLDGRHDRDDIVAEIERITQMGMNNEIPFEESLARRLQLIRPHREHIAQATDILRQSVSPSLVRQRDFIRSHQDEFFVVSGGFREIIVPIVDEIGFKEDHVFANTFLFDGEGFVTGCDTENPLSRSGGKAELIKGLGLEGQKIMIGDGYSDYEVFLKGAVDGIIISTEFVPPREFVTVRFLRPLVLMKLQQSFSLILYLREYSSSYLFFTSLLRFIELFEGMISNYNMKNIVTNKDRSYRFLS